MHRAGMRFMARSGHASPRHKPQEEIIMSKTKIPKCRHCRVSPRLVFATHGLCQRCARNLEITRRLGSPPPLPRQRRLL